MELGQSGTLYLVDIEHKGGSIGAVRAEGDVAVNRRRVGREGAVLLHLALAHTT